MEIGSGEWQGEALSAYLRDQGFNERSASAPAGKEPIDVRPLSAQEKEALPFRVHAIAMTHVTFGFWLKSVFSWGGRRDRLQTTYDNAEATRAQTQVYFQKHNISQEGGLMAMARQNLGNFGDLSQVQDKLAAVNNSLAILQAELDTISPDRSWIADKTLVGLERNLMQQQQLLRVLVKATSKHSRPRLIEISERLRTNPGDRTAIYLQEALEVLEDLVPRHLAGRMHASDLYYMRQLFTREGIAGTLAFSGDRWARSHARTVLRELRNSAPYQALQTLYPEMMDRGIEGWEVNPNPQIELSRLKRLMLQTESDTLDVFLQQSPREKLQQAFTRLATAHGPRPNHKMVQLVLEEQLRTEQAAIEFMIQQDHDPAAVRERILALREVDGFRAQSALLNESFFPWVAEKVIRRSRLSNASRLDAIDRAIFARKTLITQAGSDQQRALVALLFDKLPPRTGKVHLDILFNSEMTLDRGAGVIAIGYNPRTHPDQFLRLKLNALYTLAREDRLEAGHLVSFYDTTFGDHAFKQAAKKASSRLYMPLKRDFLHTVDGLFSIALRQERNIALRLAMGEKPTLQSRIEAARTLGNQQLSELLDTQVKSKWFGKERYRQELISRTTHDLEAFAQVAENASAKNEAMAYSPLARRIAKRVGPLTGLDRIHRAGYAVIEWADKLVGNAHDLPTYLGALLQLEEDHLERTYQMLGIPPQETDLLHALTAQRLDTFRKQLMESLPAAEVAQGIPPDKVRLEMRQSEATFAKGFGVLAAQASNRYFRTAVQLDLEKRGASAREKQDTMKALDLIVETAATMRPFQDLVATASHPEDLLFTREGLQYLLAQARLTVHYTETLGIKQTLLKQLKIAPQKDDNMDPAKADKAEMLLIMPVQRLARWPLLSRDLSKHLGKQIKANEEQGIADNDALQRQIDELEPLIQTLNATVGYVNEQTRRMELLTGATK